MSMDRAIDPAVEPYRNVVEAFRRDLKRTDCFLLPSPGAPLRRKVDAGPLGITPLQKRVLDCIAAFIDQHGHSPTYREILAAMQMRSVGQIHWLVTALEGRGMLRRRPGSTRSLQVVRGAA
jgi:hypothetical protein